MTEPTPLLKLSRITKTFGGVHALSDVSFDLFPGEVHALIGENGAGKSTLIKVITGAHRPDSGEIEIAGEPVHHIDPQLSRKLGVAVIYQQPALFPDLTVAENIALRLETGGPWRILRWGERRRRATELLDRVGADLSPDAFVRDLSMPQQQLVEIASALGGQAKVLILDEPTASLSEREVENLFRVVRELKSHGVGMIYISHRLEELPQIADRVTVLRDGRNVGTVVGWASPTITAGAATNVPSVTTASASAEQTEVNGTTRAAPASASLVVEGTRADVPAGMVGGAHPTADTTTLIRMMVGRELSAIFPKTAVKLGDVILDTYDLTCDAAGVHGVNLSVRAGEIVGLAGLVGAGRTELARVLFGLTPANYGRIVLHSREAVVDSPATAVGLGIAYVPEDRRRHGVILDLPVAANTTLAVLRTIARGGLISFGKERQIAESFVRRFGIKTPSIDTPVGHLSGGNQQKVALARWLAADPSLLILDEPTQGVDVGAKAEIHKLMGELAAKGLAILMISSELPEVLGMSDRIAVMHAGTIVGTLARAEATQERVMALALGHTSAEGTVAA